MVETLECSMARFPACEAFLQGNGTTWRTLDPKPREKFFPEHGVASRSLPGRALLETLFELSRRPGRADLDHA